ncbi:myosin heavy chain, putative [Trichomonas vaginalis G3]|uniref:Myosin heavy chain, putative n=1 Tax=Trichomonas vaginalis (strain ATCC PRA-98 / G3) TaxID=412133 RepID=A2FEJ8_TRIV3|nr:ankyrin repeat and SOCS box-containing protein 4 family [Trichomonas vaginalis G3]EAX96680.1 myosin heavy chain, putative [Trichomonas vaginalis G3]KAI5501835.1 ankyrin repeat and SOCS box-containing protein 4 family [Trichomonas vaginalis G3]|eukprot:XP_001309610.1 myosin heavy chain [Trichomonas vaginalis G3]
MNESNLEINFDYYGFYKNLESFLIYFDETNDINKCFVYSPMFNIPSHIEYFLSHGAYVNDKNKDGGPAFYKATLFNRKEIVEALISHISNVNEKKNGKTALHIAKLFDYEEIVELLISHDAKE